MIKKWKCGAKNLESIGFYHCQGSLFIIFWKIGVNFVLTIPIDFGTLWTPNLKKVDYYHFSMYLNQTHFYHNQLERVSFINKWTFYAKLKKSEKLLQSRLKTFFSCKICKINTYYFNRCYPKKCKKERTLCKNIQKAGILNSKKMLSKVIRGNTKVYKY